MGAGDGTYASAQASVAKRPGERSAFDIERLKRAKIERKPPLGEHENPAFANVR